MLFIQSELKAVDRCSLVPVLRPPYCALFFFIPVDTFLEHLLSNASKSPDLQELNQMPYDRTRHEVPRKRNLQPLYYNLKFDSWFSDIIHKPIVRGRPFHLSSSHSHSNLGAVTFNTPRTDVFCRAACSSQAVRQRVMNVERKAVSRSAALRLLLTSIMAVWKWTANLFPRSFRRGPGTKTRRWSEGASACPGIRGLCHSFSQ